VERQKIQLARNYLGEVLLLTGSTQSYFAEFGKRRGDAHEADLKEHSDCDMMQGYEFRQAASSANMAWSGALVPLNHKAPPLMQTVLAQDDPQKAHRAI
jgi:hypothetical protein